MNYRIRYHHLVKEKDIKRLDLRVKAKIKALIESKLLVDPLRFGKPLKASLKHERSLRVGDYRIVFEIEAEGLISIWKIGHRSRIYKEAEARVSRGWES